MNIGEPSKRYDGDDPNNEIGPVLHGDGKKNSVFVGVSIVVLNYNSWQDTLQCVNLLQRQNWPNYLIVVIDNASTDDSAEKMKAEWFAEKKIEYVAEYQKDEAEEGGTPDKEEKLLWYKSEKKIVLIRNKENIGYSAGNNVGIRYALTRGAEEIFIVNPDVLLEDNDVILKMVKDLFSSDDYYVAGPRVLDREGRDQNPMYEPSFGEEVFGTLWKGLMALLGKERRGCLDHPEQRGLRIVEKVSGCCMMIKSSFLRDHGLLDENIFMYSEEPILAHRVRKAGGYIVYVPEASVRHLHRYDSTDVRKYRRFISSRLYFLSRYKNYGFIKQAMVRTSYGIVLLVKLIRARRTVRACR